MATSKPGFGEISTLQLMRLIGTPDAPVIIDVCLPEDVALDPVRVPTSIAVPHHDLSCIPALAAGRDCVVLCQKGKKLSHGAAAHLRAMGLRTEVLAGGMHAWRDDGLPAIPIANLPDQPVWVTRHRPKIDRIACPWLITRFVDPRARFLYVPPKEVAAVAENFDAIAFDTVDAPFTHQKDACTFDALLDHFDLRIPPLDRLAGIVRAADLGVPEHSPEAAGLLAMSVGLSRQYKDDQAQLSAALPLYDALYRWARDGQSETHDWANEVQP
ncbi:MAG: chromate resistance protein ChrB domain-containing protein [Pseudomonadota bacterium]